MAFFMDDFAAYDATGQASLVRRREASPVELVDAAIARAEKLNPELNAIIHERFEKARAEAAEAAGEIPAGPFPGVPFVIKDLGCPTAGDPYHCGMRFLRDVGWTEPEDCHLATRFKQAGFVSIGKTNTPEIGMQPTTEPAAYGPTHNPWDLARSPGGSSGGSAAAVAARVVPIAHANDGGGSIRIPASACGLVGLKPSRGRVSNAPNPDLFGTAVQLVVSQSVRDSAEILDWVSGYVPGDVYAAMPPSHRFREHARTPPGPLRIGTMTTSPGGTVSVHNDCVIAVEKTARLLERLEHKVEVAHPPVMDEPSEAIRVYTAIYASRIETWSRRTARAIGKDDLELLTWTVAEMGKKFPATDLVLAIEAEQVRTRRFAEWWDEDGFDLLVTPTMAEPPPRLGEFVSTEEDPLAAWRRALPFITFTSAFNQNGQPAISLPLYWNDKGLPIGVQLVAAWGREDVLLRAAGELEQAEPWADRLPPVVS